MTPPPVHPPQQPDLLFPYHEFCKLKPVVPSKSPEPNPGAVITQPASMGDVCSPSYYTVTWLINIYVCIRNVSRRMKQEQRELQSLPSIPPSPFGSPGLIDFNSIIHITVPTTNCTGCSTPNLLPPLPLNQFPRSLPFRRLSTQPSIKLGRRSVGV